MGMSFSGTSVTVTGGFSPTSPTLANYAPANIRQGSNGANNATTYDVFQAAAGETVSITNIAFFHQNPTTGAGTATILVTDSANTLIQNYFQIVSGAAMPAGSSQYVLTNPIVLSSQQKIRVTVANEARSTFCTATGYKL